MTRRTNDPVAKNKSDLFPELAISLFYFIQQLHKTLAEQGVEIVYFLSREGQPLKRMFDTYRERVGGRITSHYLEVSRRSTLLPSLGPLAEETFETLFRQYRRISLLEFLSSLGLEQQTKRIADALGLSDNAEHRREDDFPTSGTFRGLKVLTEFQNLYEAERLARRRAFIDYIKELSGGKLPSRLVIVDVGWKGTIQDNIFSLLCRDNDTPVRAVTGYYVGLVAEGAAGLNNDKHGLLFSSVHAHSPKFHVFNENRALFEVVLAADHGSIVSYEVTANGKARPIRGEFEEGEMLATSVFPIQRRINQGFEQIVHSMDEKYSMSFEKAVQNHTRMVFNPTIAERTWFSSVFHVENYGVFDHSRFTAPETKPKLSDRLRFLIQVLRERNSGALGFWPWSTLYDRGGPLPAAIYATIRRMQD